MNKQANTRRQNTVWKKKLSHAPGHVCQTVGALLVCVGRVGGVFLQAHVWSERVSTVCLCVFICV